MIYWNDTGTVAGIRLFLIVTSMILGGIAAIATVAAYFGSTWWLFDYAANLRWYLFWILVVASIVYSLTARGWLLIVFVAALILNATVIVPLWLGSQPESTGEESLRIAHVDVAGGFDDRDAAIDWFAAVEADLLLIANGSTVITNALAEDGSDWIVLEQPELDNTVGQIILAKQDWDVAQMPTGAGTDTVYRITAGDDRSYEVLTAWGPTATNEEDADRLAARISTIGSLTDQASNPVIVVGNLGATVWTSGMKDLLSTTELRNALDGEGYVSTSNASGWLVVGGWLGLPLDVVLMTDQVTPLTFEAGPDISSDHLPIQVTVAPTR